jgi:exonuclease III
MFLFQMATLKKGRLLAQQTKVVHLAWVDKGTWGKEKKVQGHNEGGQLKPQGGCQLDECKAQPLRRKELRLGTWNVTGVKNREVELKDAMDSYKLDVLGVAETWLKEGDKVDIPGFQWIGVAGENRSGKGGGIGFLVRDTAWEMVGEVSEVSSRILSMQMRLGRKNCWLIQVYAPINDAAEKERETFWRELRDEVEKRRKGAEVVIMGDMNGRIGNKKEDRDLTGRYSEATQNENGMRLLELCRGSSVTAMNGWFPHKKVHQVTYSQRMNGQQDREAVLDYFCVTAGLKNAVVDVRVKRGVEIGSYHHLVIMKLDEGRLGGRCKRWNRERKWRLCTEKLRSDEGRGEYQNKLIEKVKSREMDSVEEDWQDFKRWVMEATEEAVGKQKIGGRGRSWWGEEIARLVEEKKKAYRVWLANRLPNAKEEYRQKCKEVKEAVRTAKWREWESLGHRMEKDFYGNSKRFWREVKGREKKKKIMLKDDKGRVMEEDNRITMWCRDYFEDLYNEGYKEEGTPSLVVREEAVRATQLCKDPTWSEVRIAVSKLKNGKAAGPSGMVGEMIKAGGEVMVERLVNLFGKVWKEEDIPEDWEGGIVIPLYKKGDRMDLNNYRGITLTEVASKIFGSIVRSRLEEWFEKRAAEEQAGFRKGRGCADQSYTLAQAVLKRLEVQKESHLCFVDLRKAYDSVWREGLFRKLETGGAPTKLISLIRRWYRRVRAKVRVNDTESTWFETKVGVRQGDNMSPLLFNIYINGIVEKIKEGEGGVQVGEERIEVLLYADDMVLLAEDEAGLNRMMEKVKEYCNEWKLEVNVGKTKAMVVSKDGLAVSTVEYGQEVLECVTEFTYLGTIFSADGRWEKEIRRRTQAARAALSTISREVIWNKVISMKVKRIIFEALVRSRMEFGSEVWWPSKKELGKLETVQNDFVRWAMGFQRKDRVSASQLRGKMEMLAVEDKLCQRRLLWLGRLMRMGGNRLVGRAWGAVCQGKRAKGRPRWIYAKQEAEDLARGRLQREEALVGAKWKAAVRKVGKVESDAEEEPDQ